MVMHILENAQGVHFNGQTAFYNVGGNFNQAQFNFDKIPNPNISHWFQPAPSSLPQNPSPRPSQTYHAFPVSSPAQQDEEQGVEYRPSTEEASPEKQDQPAVPLLTSLPRQVYLFLLLRLPSLYISRVEQIFRDAQLSLAEIKDLGFRSIVSEDKQLLSRITRSMENPTDGAMKQLPPSYKNMKERWENFVDSLLEEWKTLNIVSALLVPGVLTMFQIPGAASDDTVTRYLSLWSLLCALVSLLYGCMFTIQFSRMRKEPDKKTIEQYEDLLKSLNWQGESVYSAAEAWLKHRSVAS